MVRFWPLILGGVLVLVLATSTAAAPAQRAEPMYPAGHQVGRQLAEWSNQ